MNPVLASESQATPRWHPRGSFLKSALRGSPLWIIDCLNGWPNNACTLMKHSAGWSFQQLLITIPYHTILYYTTPSHNILHHTIPYYTTPHHPILHLYFTLPYLMPYNTIHIYSKPHYTMLSYAEMHCITSTNHINPPIEVGKHINTFIHLRAAAYQCFSISLTWITSIGSAARAISIIVQSVC